MGISVKSELYLIWIVMRDAMYTQNDSARTSDAFKQGWGAAIQNRPESHCLYTKPSAFRTAWLAGFHAWHEITKQYESVEFYEEAK